MANDIKIRLSTDGAAAVSADFRAVAAEVNKLGDRIDKAFKPQLTATEAAFRQLGIGGSKAFQDLERAARAEKIQAAFQTIQKSSFATGAEVDRASKAMQSSLAALNAGAGAGGAGFGKLQAAAAQATGVLGQAGISTGVLGQAIGALTSPIGVSAIAFGALSAIAIKATESLQDNVKAVKALQNVSGLEAAEASKLSGALSLMGKDSDVITRAFFKMGAEIESGGSGLARLGVAIRDSSGQLKNEGALFLELRDRMAGIGDAATRNALLMDVFGRSGRELISVVGLSKEKFDGLLGTAQRLNPVTQEMIDKTMVLTRAQREHDLAWQGLMNTIGMAVVGPMAAVTHWATKMIELAKDPIVFTIKFITGQPLQGNEGFFADISKKVHDALAAGGLTGGHLDVDLSKNDETFGLSRAATPNLPGKAQVAAEIALIAQREHAALSSLALVEAKIKDSVARNLITETQAVEQEIALAIRRRDLEIGAANAIEAKIRAGVLGGNPARETEQGKAIQEQEGKRQDVVAKSEAIIQGLRTKTFQVDQQLAQFEIQDIAKMALAAQASADARLAINSKLALDLVAIQGSGEAQFMARLTAETGALLEQATVQIKNNQQLTDTLAKIWEVYYAKLGAFQQQSTAQRVAEMVASTQMDLKDAAALPEVAKLTTDLVALNRELMALKAPTDLDAESIKRFGVSFDLLDEATKKALLSLRAVREETAQRSFADELANINTQAAVLGPTFDAIGPKITATQAELSRLAIASKGEITPAIAELQGQLNGLMGAKFQQDLKQALGLTRTVFDDLVDAGRGTASALYGGFSDLFFDLFTGQVKSLGDVFENFGKSMLRVLANFLASAVVRQLLGFFGDLIGLFGDAGGGGWVNALSKAFGGTGVGGSGSGSVITAALGGAGKLLGLFSDSVSTSTASVAAYDQSIDTLGLSLSGTTKAVNLANTGVSNFAAGLGAATSALGVGLGIYGLTRGGSAGSMAISAAGTAVSTYGLAVSISQILANQGIIAASSVLPTLSVLVAQGFAAVAPATAAAVGTALSSILPTAVTAALTGTTAAVTAAATAAEAAAVAAEAASVGMVAAEGAAGAAAGAGAAGAITGILGALAPVIAIAAAFTMMGLAGKASDAEDAAQQNKEHIKKLVYASTEMGAVAGLFADVHGALSAANLPATIHLLHDAMRDMPQLAHAVGLGAGEIAAMTDEWRARTGTLFLAALDAAHKAGIDLTPGGPDAAANSIGETLQYPYRVQRGQGGSVALNGDEGFRGLFGQDQQDWVTQLLDHMLGTIWDLGQDHPDATHAFDPTTNTFTNPAAFGGRLGGIQNIPGQTVFSRGETGQETVDINALNKFLDGEYLTVTLRNAVVDVGKMFGLSADQFAAAGLGRDNTGVNPDFGDAGSNWRMSPGDATGQGWTGILPSAAVIADVQKRLEAAGFTPGNYGKALEDFLVSIDANIVSNPMWKHLTDALAAGDAAGDPNTIQKAVNAALVASMTPLKFYDAAKAASDALATKLKELLQARADGIAHGVDTKAVDASIEQLSAAIKAYSGLVTLYTGLPVEMAAITGDLTEQTKAAVDAWAVSAKSLADTVTEAQKAFDEAITSGNIIAIQGTAQQLHDAAINRYNAELKMVQQIEAAIKGILDQAAGLVDMVTKVAQWDISAHGDFGTIGALITTLQATAEHGATAAVQLWAVDQALKAIIATLPTAISKFGGMQTSAEWLATGTQTAGQLRAGEHGPSQITQSVIAAAAPFLAVQQAAINQATGGARLGLLQQQAADLSNLAAAAVAGVQQWAQQAIAGARAAADEVLQGLTAQRDLALAAIDLEIKGIQDKAQVEHDARMAEIDGIQAAAALAHDKRMAEIESIQEGARVEQEARAAQMDALREQIAKAQELESAVKGMGEFIAQLTQGPLGPGNPMDKLTLAQDAFAKALSAYNANPTAAGLTGLQGLAQTMLSLAEPIFSKPSPQFQALSATTIKQLEAAQATAAGMMTDSQVLKAQLDALQAADKAATQGVAEQIKAIQDADKAAGDKATALIKAIQDADTTAAQKAKDLIEALNLQKEKITTDFTTQTAAIEAAFVIQKKAIEDAATAEITGINDGVAAALKANFEKQVPLLQAQYDAALAEKAAIPETKIFQDETVRLLGLIQVALASVIPAESGMARVTEGLYHLHDDEMVLPKHMADRIRSAADGAGLGDPDPHLNDWKWIYNQPRDLSVESKMWGGPRAAELNRLQLTIAQLTQQFESSVAHQYGKSRGKIYENFSDAQLAVMRSALAAQVAGIQDQQRAIIATIPKTPPPGTPGTKTPPYVPPGPGWLSRADAMQTGGQPQGTTVVFQITGSKQDAEAIAATIKEVLPAVQADIKNGKSGALIDQRVKSLPRR